MTREQWLEAAIASRQFVALNSDHPATPAQAELAQQNQERFQRKTRGIFRTGAIPLEGCAIANLFIGVLGYAFTGSIFGPFTAANSAILLLQGENAIGNQYATQIQRQLPMLQNPEALGYDRYTYEGVASHEAIQAIVARELAAYEAQQRPDTSSDADSTETEEPQSD